MNLGPSRLGVRLAVRQALRRPARTALMVALVALPVAAIVILATYERTSRPAEAQLRSWQSGRAAAAYQLQHHPDPARRPADEATIAALQRAMGGRAAVVQEGSATLRRGAAATRAAILARDDDPLLAGTLLVTEGRLARSKDEIALSEPVARTLGVSIGDTITDGSGSNTVVGTVALPGRLEAPVAQVSPDGNNPAGVHATTVFGATLPADEVPLGFLPGHFTADEGLYADEDGPDVAWVYLLGGIVLLVGAIVAATAFAVSTRRRLRELGLLAANGATPGQLAWLQSLEGVVVGAIAAVVGVVGGLAAALIAVPRAEGLAGHLLRAPEVAVTDLAVAAALGIAAAGGAAWMPARASFSLSTLAALAGRRPPGRVHPAVSYIGAVLVGFGAGLLLWVASLEFGADLWSFSLGGVVIVVLGTVLLTVRIVGSFEGLARWGRGPTRLALRSLGRERARSAAVVAAVMAAGAVAIGGSAAMLSADLERPHEYQRLIAADQVVVTWGAGADWGGVTPAAGEVPSDVVDAIATILPGGVSAPRIGVAAGVSHDAPGAESVPTDTPQLRDFVSLLPPDGDVLAAAWPPGFKSLLVATPELVRVLNAPSEAMAAAEKVDVVAFAPDDHEVIAVNLLTARGGGRPMLRPVRVVFIGTPRADLWGRPLVAANRLDDLGLEPRPAGVAFRSTRPLTSSQRNALDELVRSLQVTDPEVEVLGQPPYVASTSRQLWLSGLALLFTLGVVALGLALMAAESRAEHALLAAVGASRRTLARLRSVQAGCLALLGGLLAVPVGFGSVAAYLQTEEGAAMPFPTLTAAAVVILIPALVAVMSGLSLRSGRVSATLLAVDD